MAQKSNIKDILSEFIKNYPTHFALLFLLLLLESAAAAGSVLSIVPIADYLFDPTFSNPSRITSLLLNYFSYLGISVNFWIVGSIFVFFNFINGGLKIIIRYAILKIKYVILRGLLRDSLTKFFNSRWEFFSSSEQGHLLNTLNKELPIVGDTLGHLATQVAQIVQFCVYITIPLWLNFSMASSALILVIIFAMPFLFLNKYSYTLGKENTRTANIAIGALNEILQAARIILGFGRGSHAKSSYLKAFDAHVAVSIKSQVLTLAIPMTYTPFGMMAVIISLGFAIQQQANMSEVVAIIWSLFSILPILSSLLQTNISIKNFIPSYEQLKLLRKKAADLAEIDGDTVFKNLKNNIKLQNVDFSYSTGEKIFSKLNMCIKKGEVTAIVGESGSGKSTIVDLILGLQVPSNGNILVDNIPLEEINKNTFRQKVGYVPQDPILFYGSIRENLLWASSLSNEKELWNSLEISNADKFVKNLPEGIDTIVGDRGARLSGGQRQRIALARALIRNPELLILDEATSSLDTSSEMIIQDTINKISNRMTIVIIAHRLSTIKKAHQVIVLKSGKVVERGSYEDLSANTKGIFYNMLK